MLTASILACASAETPRQEARPERRAIPFAIAVCEGFSLESLGWLAGRWIGERDGVFSEEFWLPPAGGMMLGLHRDIPDSGAAFFEFLRIGERDQGVVEYVASPAGREPTTFLHTGCVDGMAQFFNPGHDYPQRIVYQRLGVDSLKAGIYGTVEGEERSTEWIWRRADPPAGNEPTLR